MTERPSITTLAELKATGYQSASIKQELSKNLRQKIKEGQQAFEGIWGFEHTVIPQLEQALLAGHNINLLGLRGQAKTRLARLMVDLLDEWIPYVSGSEINDDQLQPVSRYAKALITEEGDNTPISWLHRSERFYEKLATPDVTVADLIGDIDPIKAANLKLSYADDRVIHYGMVPRANRCIFVINELPDLQARIQVALLNILQEGDVQIRGFQLRMPLDIQFVFTANPEDYTNRGSIITPLKDRIGSQILTHYPFNIETARKITEQEADNVLRPGQEIYIPEPAKNLLEQIGFEARKSSYVDAKSGVSARLSISAYECLLSTAERRTLRSGRPSTAVRLSDFRGTIPAITGKLELVYEGEQEGAAEVAALLIEAAARSMFEQQFPRVEKLERPGATGPYTALLEWFGENELRMPDEAADEVYRQQLDQVKPLNDLLKKYQPDVAATDRYFMMELILWGLAAARKLSKQRLTEEMRFSEPISGFER